MRTNVERELRRMEVRLSLELRRELDERMLELTRHVDAELAAITARIDDVHRRALRALTHEVGKGNR